jgi:chaperonin cofactor prefoldin
LKVQTEIAYLSRHKAQLAERLSEAEGLSQLDQQDSERHHEELRKLEDEKVCKISVKLVGNIFYFINVLIL